MIRFVVGALALALAAAHPAAARDCPAPGLCAFEGDWAADGTSFGKPARVTMRWSAVLGGKFARVDYRIETKGEGGGVFEGVGYYRPGDGGLYDGAWFDSQGAMHPLKAVFAGATLTTHWGVEGKTYGRTTHAATGDGVEVVDAIQGKDGAWKEFSRNVLRKAD